MYKIRTPRNNKYQRQVGTFHSSYLSMGCSDVTHWHHYYKTPPYWRYTDEAKLQKSDNSYATVIRRPLLTGVRYHTHNSLQTFLSLRHNAAARGIAPQWRCLLL